MPKRKIITIILTIVTLLIVAGSLIGVGYMVLNGAKEPEYTIENNILNISGMYSADIPLADATVELSTKSLVIQKRTNGYSNKGVLKGSFMVEGIESTVYLNMYNTEASYISILNDGKYYFINCKDNAQTDILYSQILESKAA